jgi:hypothetical protein
MAAGLGFKTFATGDVLSAADTNGYLMQGVLVFASAAARDSAITSPQEGQFAYLKDTNVTTYYTGSAWANLDTTGMTNPMTTTGDTIYSSSGSTPARLGIGTTGQILTVAGGLPTWSSPSGGAKSYSLLSTTNLTAASTITVSGLSGYDDFLFLIEGWDCGTASTDLEIRFNADTGTNYRSAGFSTALGATYDRQLLSSSSANSTRLNVGTLGTVAGGGAIGSTAISMTGCNSSGTKVFTYISGTLQQATSTMARTRNGMGVWSNSAVVSSISCISTAGNFNGGTIRVYAAV